MPHREKLAWLTLISLLIASSVYFGVFGPTYIFLPHSQ